MNSTMLGTTYFRPIESFVGEFRITAGAVISRNDGSAFGADRFQYLAFILQPSVRSIA